MKLPEKGQAPVQKFASEPTGQAAGATQSAMRVESAKAGAVQQAGQALTGFAELQISRNVQRETSSSAMQISAFEQQNAGKEYYEASELPEDLEVAGGRTQTIMRPDGTAEEVPRRIPRAEVYPQLYKRQVDGIIKNGSSNIGSKPHSEAWTAKMQATAEGEYARQLQNAEGEMLKQLQKEQTDLIKTHIKKGEFGAANFVAANFEGTDLERKQFTDLVAVAEERAFVVDLIANGADDPAALETIEATIASLEDLEGTSYRMSDEQRLENAKDLRAVAKTNVMNSEAVAARKVSQPVSDLEVRIRDGDPRATRADVQALYDNGLITEPRMTSMKADIGRNQAAADDRAYWDMQLNAYKGNRDAIDYENKDLVAAVDREFGRMLREGNKSFAATSISAMQQFGVVPSEVQSFFRSNNRSGSDRLAESVPMYQEALRYAPNSLADLSDQEAGIIANIAARADAGMTVPAAIQAEKNWEAMPPDQRKAYLDTRKERGTNNTPVLKDLLSNSDHFKTGWTERMPDVPMHMQNQFNTMVEAYLPQLQGDVAAAQRRAFQTISKQWSMTDINKDVKGTGKLFVDKQFMQHAPVGDTAAMRADIDRQFPDMNVMITSDVTTRIQAAQGIPPSYRVTQLDSDGEIIGYPEVRRWTFDAQGASESLKAQTQAKAAEEYEKKKARMNKGRSGYAK